MQGRFSFQISMNYKIRDENNCIYFSPNNNNIAFHVNIPRRINSTKLTKFNSVLFTHRSV